MSHGKSDEEVIRTTHNTARYFTETRHVAWVLLVATVVWGIYGYFKAPKRKDPEIPVRFAAVVAIWPGASAEKVEEILTQKIEEKISENAKVKRITSNTRNSVAVITLELQEGTKDFGKEFDDVHMRLDTIHDLPNGAWPIQFLKDFGTTSALMLTVASPKVDGIELQLRAESLRQGIEEVRAGAVPSQKGARRATLAYLYPATIDPRAIRRTVEQMGEYTAEHNLATDVRYFEGRGFFGLDAETKATEDQIRSDALRFLQDRLRTSEIHPDVWRPAVIFDPKETEDKLRAVAEAKYSYRELDDFTDTLRKKLQSLPAVSKVQRWGVLPERIYLEYSQERIAQYALQSNTLANAIGARNITVPGGSIEAQGKNISLDPSGELKSEKELGDILVALSASGSPVYLRDIFEISRGYEAPRNFRTSTRCATRRGTGSARAR